MERQKVYDRSSMGTEMGDQPRMRHWKEHYSGTVHELPGPVNHQNKIPCMETKENSTRDGDRRTLLEAKRRDTKRHQN